MPPIFFPKRGSFSLIKNRREVPKMQASREQKRPLEIELSFPVQTYDIDFAGIVSNIVYIRWLEDLRLALAAPYFPVQKMLENGVAPLLVKTAIEYKQPINIFDKPTGKIWMSKMKSLKWMMDAEIIVAGKVAAIAQQSGCFIALSTRRPVPIPAELSQAYLAQQ
jgi:acyl-CoA thioester hydrolase